MGECWSTVVSPCLFQSIERSDKECAADRTSVRSDVLCSFLRSSEIMQASDQISDDVVHSRVNALNVKCKRKAC